MRGTLKCVHVCMCACVFHPSLRCRVVPSWSYPGRMHPQSFIHRVKAHGAQGMLGKFSNTGLNFDRTLSDLTVTKVAPPAGPGSPAICLPPHPPTP
jgi:hypothetical protein